jgi:hypothetical protein
MSSPLETAARAAFVAYNEAVEPGKTPWKTWDGKDVPRWDGLNDSVRAKWGASVMAAVLAERERCAKLCADYAYELRVGITPTPPEFELQAVAADNMALAIQGRK